MEELYEEFKIEDVQNALNMAEKNGITLATEKHPMREELKILILYWNHQLPVEDAFLRSMYVGNKSMIAFFRGLLSTNFDKEACVLATNLTLVGYVINGDLDSLEPAMKAYCEELAKICYKGWLCGEGARFIDGLYRIATHLNRRNICEYLKGIVDELPAYEVLSENLIETALYVGSTDLAEFVISVTGKTKRELKRNRRLLELLSIYGLTVHLSELGRIELKEAILAGKRIGNGMNPTILRVSLLAETQPESRFPKFGEASRRLTSIDEAELKDLLQPAISGYDLLESDVSMMTGRLSYRRMNGYLVPA